DEILGGDALGADAELQRFVGVEGERGALPEQKTLVVFLHADIEGERWGFDLREVVVDLFADLVAGAHRNRGAVDTELAQIELQSDAVLIGVDELGAAADVAIGDPAAWAEVERE